MQQLRQEFRQKLEQYLQPQQILRSELIQLPMLELELRVRAELQENPFLDELPEEEAIVEKELAEVETESSAASVEARNDEPAPSSDLDLPDQDPKSKEDEVDWDNFLNDEDHYTYKATRYDPDEFQELPRPSVQSLSEYLEDQLRLQRMTEEEYEVGLYIIGSINRDGYLSYPIEEIARERNVTVEAAMKVLRVIQQLDPPGIGARDLRECLLIQLRQREDQQKAALPIRVLEEANDAFMNKRYEIIARKLNISLDDVKQTFAEIRKLNPKPGEGYFDEKQNYIVPDLVVTKVSDEGEFAVYLSDGNIPNF
ncbi:RNA polymerase sigma-54 factor, partial [bacterium]